MGLDRASYPGGGYNLDCRSTYHLRLSDSHSALMAIWRVAALSPSRLVCLCSGSYIRSARVEKEAETAALREYRFQIHSLET
jgi:hypothetical protein